MSQESSSVFKIKYEHEVLGAQEQVLQQVFAQATPAAVPTGILFRTALNGSPLASLAGDEDASALSQAEFEILLDELRDAVLPQAASASPLAGSDAARERAAAHRELGLTPIFVASHVFHVVRNRVWAGLERMGDNGAAELPWDDPAQLFEERRAFMAAAMAPSRFAGFAPLPHLHFGRQIRFVVPSDGFFGNGPAPDQLRVDFGDGLGFREVRLDEPVEVDYGSAGDKALAIRGVGPEGEATAYCRLTVADDIIERLRRDYDVSIHQVEGKIPTYPPAKAEGLLFRQKGAPITQPVLMVEGFPFNYSWTDIFNYANQQSFATGLVARGHAVMLVRFPTGPREIQASAFALIEMIKLVNGFRVGNAPLTLGGFSMGGLVARYALAYMEHPRWGQPDHQVGKFFTVDTPHEGANVSVAVQAFAQVEDPGGEQASLMRSPAARQVLLNWVPGWDEWSNGREFGAHGLRVQLVAELRELGVMPKRPDTIAIANGAGNGKINQAAPGSFATGYTCERKAWASLFLCPRSGLGAVLAMRRRHVFDWTIYRVETMAEPLAYDSLPGGIWEQPIFRRVWERFGIIPRRSLEVENGSFIPTVSALGIKVDDHFRPLTLEDLRSSYFKKVTYHQGSPDNEVHIRLTPQLVAFLREHVFGYKAADHEQAEPAEAPLALSADRAL